MFQLKFTFSKSYLNRDGHTVPENYRLNREKTGTARKNRNRKKWELFNRNGAQNSWLKWKNRSFSTRTAQKIPGWSGENRVRKKRSFSIRTVRIFRVSWFQLPIPVFKLDHFKIFLKNQTKKFVRNVALNPYRESYLRQGVNNFDNYKIGSFKKAFEVQSLN